MKLTPEELEELKALEAEEKQRLEEEKAASLRQHLEALRTSKRLSSKLGRPGHDFVVLETKVGNFVVRKPKDVDLDALSSDAPEGDRAQLETLAVNVVVEPDEITLRKLMAENPGLAPAITTAAVKLAKVTLEEEAKK